MRWRLCPFVGLMLAVCSMSLGSAHAATTYPTRSVQIIVGFGPASATDLTGRIIAQRLSQTMGQQFVVVNRPGAGSTLAGEQVVRAPKDGYTLFLSTVANVINDSMQPNLPFNFTKDFTPITLATSSQLVLVALPSSGISSVKDLIARAKKAPGKIFFGSAGVGTAPHLSGELFNMLTGTKMVGVPYPGSAQAVTDLLAGRTQVMFSPISTVLAHIRAGQLKALAVTEATRSSALPNVPTVEEAGVKGFETSLWIGFVAPKGTPQAIVDKLSAGINEALKNPATAAALRKTGLELGGGSPSQFGTFIKKESKKWAAVVKTAGLQKKH